MLLTWICTGEMIGEGMHWWEDDGFLAKYKAYCADAPVWRWHCVSELMDEARQRRFRKFLCHCACLSIAKQNFQSARHFYQFS